MLVWRWRVRRCTVVCTRLRQCMAVCTAPTAGTVRREHLQHVVAVDFDADKLVVLVVERALRLRRGAKVQRHTRSLFTRWCVVNGPGTEEVGSGWRQCAPRAARVTHSTYHHTRAHTHTHTHAHAHARTDPPLPASSITLLVPLEVLVVSAKQHGPWQDADPQPCQHVVLLRVQVRDRLPAHTACKQSG